MKIDELIAQAVAASYTPFGQAQARRTLREAEERYRRALAAGVDVTAGHDLSDPLHIDATETAQIARAAQLALLGRFTWVRDSDEMSWSDEIWTMLGYDPVAAPRPSKKLFLFHLHPRDRNLVEQAINAAWAEQRVINGTYRFHRKDGIVVDVECHLEATVDEHGTPSGVIGTGQDVTTRERARQEVERLRRRCETVRAAIADWDPDSGLFTRRRFADELDRASRFGAGAVLILRIEPVDDPASDVRFGDGADLPGLAARLLESLKEPGDQLGRVGPSEIGVLFPKANLPRARKWAEYFVETLRSQHFVTADGRLRALAWGGLVRYAKNSPASSQDILIDAETSWREAKQEGRPVVALGQPTQPHDRQSVCRDRIATALRTDQFTVYAQPILELASNAVTRYELLLRVIDDVNGMLPPSGILETAERLDAVFEIDLWVFDRAVELLATSDPSRHFQVNVSGRSLGDARLMEAVENRIRDNGINPEQLTFEITETALIGNFTEARRFVDRIHDLGCHLALDDFGSGHASFRYLKLFPIDLVKIDGGFIDGLTRNHQDQVMVQAIIQVCQAHGVQTLAEFVEDEETLELLSEMGVDFAQGYLVGRPRSAASLAAPTGQLRRVGAANHRHSLPGPAGEAPISSQRAGGAKH
jgi:PAS domain S-box-containing protein